LFGCCPATAFAHRPVGAGFAEFRHRGFPLGGVVGVKNFLQFLLVDIAGHYG